MVPYTCDTSSFSLLALSLILVLSAYVLPLCYCDMHGSLHQAKMLQDAACLAASFARFTLSRVLSHVTTTLECLINVPVRVFISRKMPPYTGLIWHYTFIKKKKKKKIFVFFYIF